MEKQFSDNNPPRRLRVESIRFKRMKDSDWEIGLLINEGDGVAIDMDGKTVPSVWDVRKLDQAVMTLVEEE